MWWQEDYDGSDLNDDDQSVDDGDDDEGDDSNGIKLIRPMIIQEIVSAHKYDR